MDLMQEQTPLMTSTAVTTKTIKKSKKLTQVVNTSSNETTFSSILHKNVVGLNEIHDSTAISSYHQSNGDEHLKNNVGNSNKNNSENSTSIITEKKNKCSKKIKSNKQIDKIDSTEEKSNQYENNDDNNNNIINNNNEENHGNTTTTEKTRKISTDLGLNGKSGKKKTKKSKNLEDNKQIISMDTRVDKEPVCHKCDKITYKMEEIKAEGRSWHKVCFKCKVCNKQLNVDTFESHEGILYCKPHFKILMAPKAVEDFEPEKPKKLGLIICENHPVELPPDVVRASDKIDLGLEELQLLNVRSKFQVFENYQENGKHQKEIVDRHVGDIKRNQSILQKLAKFQKKEKVQYSSDNNECNSEDEEEEFIDSGEEDADLVRVKRAQRERPIRFDQINDIKSKFESGTIPRREERREERKQELQNIRSRLFLGKQARIKEQYQQAVAESEQGIIAASKKPDIDIGDKAKLLKEKFENGEMFKEHEHNKLHDEMDIFESGISKQSRSHFMELDATALKNPAVSICSTPRTPDSNTSTPSLLQEDQLKPFKSENVVKCDEKQEDIKIETSEISSKFKFFETYKSQENKKRKEFRITPPREGVVKMPSLDQINEEQQKNSQYQNDPIIAAEQHTTTKMLNRFRELEQQKHIPHGGIKPLKAFTPPPDENRRIYVNYSDDEDEEEEEEFEEECEEENDDYDDNKRYQDEFLQNAQSAARAKQLRAKFEKWEANEIKREMNNITGFALPDNTEESQIESAKSLRVKFEQLKSQPAAVLNKPKIQVNRFV